MATEKDLLGGADKKLVGGKVADKEEERRIVHLDDNLLAKIIAVHLLDGGVPVEGGGQGVERLHQRAQLPQAPPRAWPTEARREAGGSPAPAQSTRAARVRARPRRRAARRRHGVGGFLTPSGVRVPRRRACTDTGRRARAGGAPARLHRVLRRRGKGPRPLHRRLPWPAAAGEEQQLLRGRLPARNRFIKLPPPPSTPNLDSATSLRYELLDPAEGIIFRVLVLRADGGNITVDTFSSASGTWESRELGVHTEAFLFVRPESPGISTGQRHYWLDGQSRDRVLVYDEVSGTASVLRESPTQQGGGGLAAPWAPSTLAPSCDSLPSTRSIPNKPTRSLTP